MRGWCGRAYGRLRHGRLADPRLDLACTTARGETVAFAWIQASPTARYLVVRHPTYAESYLVRGDLPVRIVGSDVDVTRSSAAFDVSEHAANGRLVRRFRLRARVAG
jgi:hypothetical protein